MARANKAMWEEYEQLHSDDIMSRYVTCLGDKVCLDVIPTGKMVETFTILVMNGLKYAEL